MREEAMSGETTLTRSRAQSTYWMSFARCRDMDPDVFFPSDGAGVERARLVCAECPVREPCLSYALEQEIVNGVWGGASERYRARILRQRRLARRDQLAREDAAGCPS